MKAYCTWYVLPIIQRSTLIFGVLFMCLIIKTKAGSKTDSLYTVLNQTNSDSVKVLIHTQLSSFLVETNYRRCIKHAKLAIEIGERVHGLTSIEPMFFLGKTHWYHSDYDEATKWLYKAKSLSIKQHNDEYLAKILDILGMLHYYRASFDSAIYNLTESYDLFVIQNDSSKISDVSNNLGWVYEKMGKYTLSTEALVNAYKVDLKFNSILDHTNSTTDDYQFFDNIYFTQDFIDKEISKTRLASQKNDSFEVAERFFRLGYLYLINDHHDSSVFYLNKSYTVFDEIGEHTRKAQVLLNMGRAYNEIEAFDQAEHYFQESLSVFTDEHCFGRVDYILELLGKLNLKTEKPDVALTYFHKALVLSDTIGHPMAVSLFHRRISEVYLLQNKIRLAINHANEAYKVASNVGSLSNVRSSAKSLYQAYKKAGMNDQSLHYFEEYHSLSSEREQAVVNRSKQEFQVKLELQEKNLEIKLLNSDNKSNQEKLSRQMIFIVVSVMCFLVILGFTIALRRRMSKEKTLNTQVTNKNEENELLLAEIHHRVKNNLQVITSLLSMQERSVGDKEVKAAILSGKQRINSMELVHKMLYIRSVFNGIEMKTYIKSLFQALVDSFVLKKMNVNLLVDFPSIMLDTDTAIPLGLILNELITNSIKHGAIADHEKLVISIDIKEKEGALVLHYSDNGKGKAENMKDSKSFGLRIINSFVKQLQGETTVCEKEGLDYTFYIKNYKILKQDEN